MQLFEAGLLVYRFSFDTEVKEKEMPESISFLSSHVENMTFIYLDFFLHLQ